jgi:hypothetical protein
MCFYSILATTTVPVTETTDSSPPFTTDIGKVAILLVIRRNITFVSFAVYPYIKGMNC